MGDRSMKECLQEQLVVLRLNAPGSGFDSLEQWYSAGADVHMLCEIHAEGVHGMKTTEQSIRVCYAWGYIEGAADLADLTVSELLDNHGLTFDAPEPTKRQKIRKVKTS